MFVGELESLDQTQSFIHGATNWQIVDSRLAQNAVWIDQEQTTESDAGFLDQNIVAFGDLVISIRDQSQRQVFAQTTFFARSVDPVTDGVYHKA